ncbi:MAG: T9SS type A sorting domain-containing protein [Siphonobacter aquaeclarae]|nr:T9SS type A sorting domain-containing protein [Siphonobacter aquaeclarae]
MKQIFRIRYGSKFLFISLLSLLVGGTVPSALLAQTAITGANLETSAVSTGSNYSTGKAKTASSSLSHSGNYLYTFGNQSGFTDNRKKLLSFGAGGSVYSYKLGETPVIKIRRVENAAFTQYYNTTGYTRTDNPTLRDLAYYEGLVDNTAGTVQIKSAYIPKMEDLFLTNDITIGIDNLFANTYTTNFNNIERIDVITQGGRTILSPAQEGFALFERGGYNVHDPVVVAVITGLDAQKNPSSYATKVVRIGSPDYYVPGQTTNTVYQPTNTAVGNFIILRRDNASSNLQASDLIGANQGIGGVLVKYADFNLAAGTKVYGYSVLANDFPVTGTGANVVDYTNTTYFPTNSSDATQAAGNDMATITGVVRIITIKGNVFRDADGLTNGLVDGPGINNPDGTPLYINLVNADNKVVGTAVVQPDGSYTLSEMELGTLSAQVSTTRGTVGSTPPAANLPANWVNTGEYFGIGNAAGSGNEASGDGKIAVLVGDTDISEVNFGIETIPSADDKTTDVQRNPGGTTQVPVPTLTGKDPEDGTYTGVSKTNTVKILTLPNEGTLYYDGVAVKTNQVIPNYDPAKLTADPQDGAVTVSFTYAFIDKAEQTGTPGTVTMPFTQESGLPVSLTRFSATATDNKTVVLNWETANERNNRRFILERSLDLVTFSMLGSVEDVAGTSTSVRKYSFTDQAAVPGTSYYRLIQEDVDGKRTAYKPVSVVIRGDGYVIAPNPVTSRQFTVHVDEPETATLELRTLSGVSIPLTRVSSGSGKILLQLPGQQAGGLYLLEIKERGQSRVHKVMIL